MKKGFALVETIVVITFLSVSLLALFSTFKSMLNNTKQNLLYDDIANIYKAYYVKEYLQLSNREVNNIEEITCLDITCEKLKEQLNISKIYIVSPNGEYNPNNFSSMFNNYYQSLSKKDADKKRVIIEFINNEEVAYTNLILEDYHE